MSSNTLVQILTCLSSITDSGSLAIAVQGNHSNVVRSVWEQLLQCGCGGGAWYQNLHRDAKHVRDQHSSKCTDFKSKTIISSVKSKKHTMNSCVYFQTRKKLCTCVGVRWHTAGPSPNTYSNKDLSFAVWQLLMLYTPWNTSLWLNSLLRSALSEKRSQIFLWCLGVWC